MGHKNNTGSCNTTASDANLLSLANDVMPDFKKFLKRNFKSIIITEIEEIKKKFKKKFTAVAYTYPTDRKEFKYDYLFTAITIERPTIEESYKLMQNFATYSVEDKYLIDLSLKDIALVFTEGFWKEYMIANSISDIKKAFLKLYSIPLFVDIQSNESKRYIVFYGKEIVGVARVLTNEVWVIDSYKHLKEFDKEEAYKIIHLKNLEQIRFDIKNYVVNNNINI